VAPSRGYSSLICDREQGKYRIFYEKFHPDNERIRYLCLLESEDMVHFTPVLNEQGDPVVYDGNGGVHGCSVLFDPMDPDPNRRYKFAGMTGMERSLQGFREKCSTGVTLAFSPDGVRWEHHPELIATPNTSDALNKLFFNPCTQEYTLCHRSAYVDRRIAVRTSKDLVHWSEPRTILHPASVYNTEHTQMQHYSLSANWFDGIFYGLLWRFPTDLRSTDFTKMFGTMDVELVYSYDGREFLYTSGKPLMERPMAPTPGWAGLTGNDMCESLDGQYYYLLSGAYQIVHGTIESNKRLIQILKERGVASGGHRVYRIRKDGFCGIESVSPGGRVITKPLCLLKDDLTFNLRADCGTVRFGLMTKKGEYLEGFSLEDCVPFEFDQGLEIRPRWKEKELSQILGQQVRVVVELNGAILHAMSATARPFITQEQVSFSNPAALL